jgi:hypothetical protein
VRVISLGDRAGRSGDRGTAGIANKLAQRRIELAYIIAWSCWRRAHQAKAKRAHLKTNMQS